MSRRRRAGGPAQEDTVGSGAGVFQPAAIMRRSNEGLWRCAFLGSRDRQLGYDVRLIPPAHVKPFVKRQKNDAARLANSCDGYHRHLGNPAKPLRWTCSACYRARDEALWS